MRFRVTARLLIATAVFHFAGRADMPTIAGAVIVPAATLIQAPAISGHISYYAMTPGMTPRPVPTATVNLVSSTPQTTSSDVNGQYQFSSAPSGMISLQANKQGQFNPPTAVSALDATFVQQYVAALRSLTSDQRLAADVTGDGTVSALDATRILQFVAGIKRCSVTRPMACTMDADCPPAEVCTLRFAAAQACGSDWLFRPVPAPAPNQTLVQPQLSSNMCQQGAINYSSAPAALSGQDFIAILFGDTTGNWTPA